MSKKKNSECLSGVEVSPSPAGRTAILQLLPLSIPEFAEAGIMMDRASALFKGFMPVLYDFNVEPELFDRNGYMTGTVRDARQFDQLQQPVQRCGSVRFNTPNSSRSCNPDFTQVPFPDTERRPCPGAVIYSGKLTPTIEKPDSSNSSIPRISLPHNGKKAR